MELLVCVEESAQMKLSCACGAEPNASVYRKMGTKLKLPGNKQESIQGHGSSSSFILHAIHHLVG